MGSKTFDGVFFIAYSKDHPPPHVHGFYGGAEVILELDFESRKIRLADRKDRVKPKAAKKSEVKRIIIVAGRFADEILALWEGSQP